MSAAKLPHSLLAICLVTSLLWSGHAYAGISGNAWWLDQSNEFSDGVNYGKVTIVANSNPGVGTVEFRVDAFNVQPTYGTLNNFGIQSFGFNYQNLSSPLTASMVSGLDDPNWTVASGNQDGFGFFEVTLSGDGDSRRNPLEFTITLPTASDAVLDNFTVLSEKLNGGVPGEGQVFFAAHVAGFANGPGSHYVGGWGEDPDYVPAPPAVILGLVGLGAVSFVKRRVSGPAA
jgi:hypothetical protein